LLLLSSVAPLPLQSFPTRRSSDLADRGDPPYHQRHPCACSLRLPVCAVAAAGGAGAGETAGAAWPGGYAGCVAVCNLHAGAAVLDRKSTRLNSSHVKISYAVFCLK